MPALTKQLKIIELYCQWFLKNPEGIQFWFRSLTKLMRNVDVSVKIECLSLRLNARKFVNGCAHCAIEPNGDIKLACFPNK
jgi:hypothetical protein